MTFFQAKCVFSQHATSLGLVSDRFYFQKSIWISSSPSIFKKTYGISSVPSIFKNAYDISSSIFKKLMASVMLTQ